MFDQLNRVGLIGCFDVEMIKPMKMLQVHHAYGEAIKPHAPATFDQAFI
ncbi:hypothetical protein [uncultured Aquitalea sp.]|nr:hypothetical protein [uncultured Aquitalea sp.]